VIEARGLLMKQQSWMGGTATLQLRRDIRAAAADPNVSAILLAIDSPGGTAAGTADLAADVRAAARQKPVWAQIEDLGASAAYWLASQADQVFANTARRPMVGSIGTYQTVYDLSAAAEQEGVKVFHFATGPLKGAGMPGTPVTEEQQADFQGRVDAVQDSFDAAVRAAAG
jgi:ClpP class serine protease